MYPWEVRQNRNYVEIRCNFYIRLLFPTKSEDNVIGLFVWWVFAQGYSKTSWTYCVEIFSLSSHLQPKQISNPKPFDLLILHFALRPIMDMCVSASNGHCLGCTCICLFSCWLIYYRAALELQNEAKSHILNHVNVVKLFAMVFQPRHYGVVLEYVRHGDLHDFISENKVRMANCRPKLRVRYTWFLLFLSQHFPHILFSGLCNCTFYIIYEVSDLRRM